MAARLQVVHIPVNECPTYQGGGARGYRMQDNIDSLGEMVRARTAFLYKPAGFDRGVVKKLERLEIA
jgi:hypothetical protein